MTAPQNPNLAANLPPQGPRRVVYLEANRPPTVLDTKYRDGSFYEFDTEWRDKSISPPNIYKLSNILSKTNAIWVLVTGGTGTIININVDTATAPGVTPVTPTSSGAITITGAQVAAGTIGANVIRTHSVALNEFTIEIQQSAAVESTDSTQNGVSHYNSAQFSVDGNGFVSLLGSGEAIDSIGVDDSSPPGTNPVLPTLGGQINVTGAQVGAGTIGANAIRTFSLAANQYTIQIQRAAAAATSSVNNAGILSADSSQFNIDSNGWLQLKASSEPSQLTNIGIKYSAGTFTVCAADGTALSATNPGIVWLQSKATPGTLKRYVVTADQTFTDGASGSFATMRWGLPPSVSYSNDIPFFIYGVGDDTETTIAFMISRIPNRNSSPVAASIGKAGAVVNNGQFDFYSLAAITVADYESNPCQLLGAFRMTFVGGTNSWLVTTLDSSDGIGIYHEQTLFVFPGGVFGAAANTYIQNNGGTAPVFASNYYSYKIYVTGECYIDMTSIGNSATDGAGTVQTNVTMPFAPVISSNPGIAKVFNPTASISYLVETSVVTTNTFALIPVSNTATGNVLENGDFTDGDRQISTSFLYTIADS